MNCAAPESKSADRVEFDGTRRRRTTEYRIATPNAHPSNLIYQRDNSPLRRIPVLNSSANFIPD
jgi:hypothetical protein